MNKFYFIQKPLQYYYTKNYYTKILNNTSHDIYNFKWHQKYVTSRNMKILTFQMFKYFIQVLQIKIQSSFVYFYSLKNRFYLILSETKKVLVLQ